VKRIKFLLRANINIWKTFIIREKFVPSVFLQLYKTTHGVLLAMKLCVMHDSSLGPNLSFPLGSSADLKILEMSVV
jgi:hypothetical protein